MAVFVDVFAIFPAIFRRHAFQHAHTGSANGDDAPSRPFGVVHPVRGFPAHHKTLFVHFMRGQGFGLHRQKSAEPHVQGDGADLNATPANLFQHLRSEMQARGRCGHRPGVSGIHRLVTLTVFGVLVITVDIRRQRRFPHFIENVFDVADAIKPQPALSLGMLFQHHRRWIGNATAPDRVGGVNPDLRAGARPFGGPQQGQPIIDRFCSSSRRISNLPPVRALAPCNRAGNTRESFNTSTSPARKKSGKSANRRCSILPLPRCRTSSRDASRRGAGRCAINSCGKSKSKSAVRTGASFGFRDSTFKCRAAKGIWWKMR